MTLLSLGGTAVRRCNPPCSDDLAVMAVPGGIFQHIALAFVEAIKHQRLRIGGQAGGRRKRLVVAGDIRDAQLIDQTIKREPAGIAKITANERGRGDAWQARADWSLIQQRAVEKQTQFTA